MTLKPLTILAFCFLTSVALKSQTYVVMVKPKDSKVWGYMKTDGEYAIQPKYKNCNSFNENGWAGVQNPETNEYEFINLEGKPLATEVKNLKGNEFNQGIAPVKNGKKWGYMDESGKLIVQTKYDGVTPFYNSTAVVRSGKDYLLIDKEGNETTLPNSIILVKDMKEGMAPFVGLNKKEGFVNEKGEIAIEARFLGVGYFNDGLAWARTTDGKIGYINQKGDWVIKPQFKTAKDFQTGEQLTRVKKDDIWTYINRDGEIVNLPMDKISDFSEGLAYGRRGDLVGYYDTKGAWVIEPQFQAVRDFKNGYAAAKKGELWGVIDKTGAWVLKPQFDGIKDVEKVK